MLSIKTPLAYSRPEPESEPLIKRELDDEIAIIDNLLELILFTPRGSFAADPEFGFEYWSHEYVNPQYSDFNSVQKPLGGKSLPTITKEDCEVSIKKSLEAYAPQLTNPKVTVNLKPADQNETSSRLLVHVCIEGEINKGLSTIRYCDKESKDGKDDKVRNKYFLMEPTTKRRKTI